MDLSVHVCCGAGGCWQEGARTGLGSCTDLRRIGHCCMLCWLTVTPAAAGQVLCPSWPQLRQPARRAISCLVSRSSACVVSCLPLSHPKSFHLLTLQRAFACAGILVPVNTLVILVKLIFG